MGSALWAGISGLNASSKEMDVIANNVANVNTIGYKAGKTFFADVLSQSISGGSSGSMQVGRGVQVTEVGTLFGSGSFETTGNATDVAIDGDGFFMVNDADGASYYTRAGAFHLNSDGYLVDTNGYKLQGYNFFGSSTGTITDISLRNIQSAPEVTSTFSVGANLNSDTTTGDAYTTTQTVYDSLGDKHSLGITFRKTEENGYWSFQCALDGTDATAQSYNGFKFDSNGALSAIYTGTVGAVTVVEAADAATAVAAIDNAGDLTAADAITLTRGASASSWTVTTHANYPNMAITSANATTVNVDADGDGGADFHLTLGGVWDEGNTAQFNITIGPPAIGAVTVTEVAPTATATVNQPGQIYQTGTMTLTKTGTGVAASDWSITGAGGYTNATILSGSATAITLDLDGNGGTDVTLALTGTFDQNDTAAFTLTHSTEATPVDLNITLAAIPTGATIGASNVITWDLAGTTALSITQYASTSVIKSLTNDGYASGLLKSLSVEDDGTLSGFFTNGQTADLAQIVLADFDNPWGLKKMGSNLFAETVTSGSAIRNVPGASGMGNVASNSLEMSNTDVATEFINMITAQKAYSASARVITTQDQMLSELMNIKR